MSWGTCYKGTNNIHFTYPPLMSDSRLFSDYRSSSLEDEKIKENSNIQTNSDYRHYLQTNADNIIKNNQLSACNEYNSCYYNNNKISDTDLNYKSNTPYIFNNTLSKDQPYGYDESDLKNIYLSREELQANMYAPRFNLEIDDKSLDKNKK